MKPLKQETNSQKVPIYLAGILDNSSLSGKRRRHLINSIRLELDKSEGIIPVSIFSNDSLGALEAIVKFLREERKLSFGEIASLVGRTPQALAVTYHASKKKMPSPSSLADSPFSLPASILRNAKFTVLENIVVYLKTTYHLTYHQIGVLLNRDDRTIWTTFNNARKKRGGA